MKNESVRRGRSKKLEVPYVGLYEIVGIEGPNSLLRTKRSKVLKIHANQAKPFFCLITDVDNICVAPTIIIAGQDIDFQIEPVQSSPGLYYKPVGTARLYSSEWKDVTYLSLKGASNNVDEIRKYIDFTAAFGVKHSNLWQPNATVCNSMLDTVKREYEKVQEMRSLVLQLTRTERGTHRQKRGIFNLVGNAAHSLFGMLDSDSEAFYNKKSLSWRRNSWIG